MTGGPGAGGPGHEARSASRLAGLVSPFTMLDGVAAVARRRRRAARSRARAAYGAAVRRHVPRAAGGQPRAAWPPGTGRRVIAMTTIELRNVSRWYGNVVAVNDITMTIGPGVTGLLGPNGAGKSTLLHMIAGFLAPSRGELTVAGAAELAQPGDLPEGRAGARAGLGLRLPHRAGSSSLPPRSCTSCPTRAAAAAGDRHLEMADAQDRQDRHLLQGHAPADQGGRGAGARPRGPAARRAVQRDGPAAAAAHDGPARQARRARAGRSCSARTSWKRSSGCPAPSR